MEITLRFDMFLNYGTDVGGSTEHAILASIIPAPSPIATRPPAATALVCRRVGWQRGDAGRSYTSYVSTNATAVLRSSRNRLGSSTPFYQAAVLVAGAPSGQWVDVEVAQVGKKSRGRSTAR